MGFGDHEGGGSAPRYFRFFDRGLGGPGFMKLIRSSQLMSGSEPMQGEGVTRQRRIDTGKTEAT